MAEVIVSIPFRYRARVVLARSRKPTVMYFRGAVPVQIERVDTEEAEIAFRIRDYFAGKPYNYFIFRYSGRLWWPFGNAYGDFPSRRSFERLQAGLLCLSGGNLATDFPPRIEDVTVREVIRNEHDEVLVAIQRTTDQCMVVGNELHSAGGVPMLAVAGPEGSPLLFNSGSKRYGDRRVRGLAVRPGNSLANDIDQLFVSDCCYRHDSLAAKRLEKEMTRSGYTKLPKVEGTATDGEKPDCFDLRTDAAFRIVNHMVIDLYRIPDSTVLRPEFRALQQLSGLFADATPHDLCHITARRLHAIYRFLFSMGDLAVLGPLQREIAGLIAQGLAAGRVSREQLDQPEWGLLPVEEEALEGIARG